MPRSPSRRAFTLVELLVVIGIMGMLMSLLLPGVQKVREAASQVKCRNNLKQLAVALMNHEQTLGHFPEGYRFDPPTRSFVPPILPFIEAGNIEYDKAKNWDAKVNQAAAKTQMKLLYCPSAPGGYRVNYEVEFQPAVSDYTVYHGVNHGYCDMVGWPRYVPEDQNGAMTTKVCHVRDIKDGTSQTFLLVEDSGRPELWRMGRRVEGSSSAGGWSDPNLEIALDGSDTLTAGRGQGYGPCVMNCTNDNEVYTFHTGGANFAFCDGSIRFIRDNVRNTVFAALVTRASGEIISPTDY